MLSHRIEDVDQCENVWEQGEIPILVDEDGSSIKILKPDVVVDAILAKKNIGTTRKMAPLTIGLGPGFLAGSDVDFVVETKRGHDLGRIIDEGWAIPNTGIPGEIGGYGKERVIHSPASGVIHNKETKRGHDLGRIIDEGWAIPNTGIPGEIGGYGKERVIHSPASGVIHNKAKIADLVEKGQDIALICTEDGEEIPVLASLDGVLRGLIREGYQVFEGMKIADIDPRKEQKKNCNTISDKARCIAGSVVEILLSEGIFP